LPRMRKGPPPGVGWYGPYHPELWIVPSQFYPHYPPRRVTCIQLGPMTGVPEQWAPNFYGLSADGVASADRKSVVYDFVPVDNSVPRYSSCRLTADPGAQHGYYSQRWEFVYGLSTFVLSYNCKWGPFTTEVQDKPINCFTEELGNGVETVNGITLPPSLFQIRPANWNLY